MSDADRLGPGGPGSPGGPGGPGGPWWKESFYLFHCVNETVISVYPIYLYGLSLTLMSTVSLSWSSNPEPRASAPYYNTDTHRVHIHCDVCDPSNILSLHSGCP